MENKLSIHFGKDETKSILFSSKRKIKKASHLNIQYKDIKIKQYSKLTYYIAFLTKLSLENLWPLVLKKKVNSRLRFLYRQHKYLDILLHRLLRNAMIQPFFDYACNAWYHKLNKNLKIRLRVAQNKYIRFCLKLGDRTSIKINEFEKVYWLPIHDRANQCTLSSIYKFHPNNAPGYMNEIFSHAECNGIPARCSYQKLKLPHRKTIQGLRVLSYIDPSLWNNFDEALKTSVSFNAFRHKLKDYHFRKGNKKERNA